MKTTEIFFETIDSTNRYAKENRHLFAKEEMTCIIAEHQTAGRGQFGRHWISPKDAGLYITFFFHLPPNTSWVTKLASLLAGSLKKVLENQNLSPEFKWPNDILIKKQKLAGVLCEVVFEPTSIEVILGLGLNVNTEKKDLVLIDQPATSLKIETGQVWDKFNLLKAIQKQFLQDLENLKNS